MSESAQDVGRLLYSVMTQACSAARGAAPVLAQIVDKTGNKRVANRLERYWMDLLHTAFKSKYSAPTYAIFSKKSRNKEFGLSEYLFDLAVVRLAGSAAISPDKKKPLPVVIQEPVWQVESEMAGNGRSVAVDLGKLVCGSATNKLLIVRRPKDQKSAPIEEVNRFVLDVAKFSQSNLFLAYLPVYATRHTDLKEIWLKENTKIPFRLFARSGSSEQREMNEIAEGDAA